MVVELKKHMQEFVDSFLIAAKLLDWKYEIIYYENELFVMLVKQYTKIKFCIRYEIDYYHFHANYRNIYLRINRSIENSKEDDFLSCGKELMRWL